jgi:hypothetical protein
MGKAQQKPKNPNIGGMSKDIKDKLGDLQTPQADRSKVNVCHAHT